MSNPMRDNRDRSLRANLERAQRRMTILHVLRDAAPDGLQVREVAQIFGLPTQVATNDLTQLRERSLVRAEGGGQGAYVWYACHRDETSAIESRIETIYQVLAAAPDGIQRTDLAAALGLSQYQVGEDLRRLKRQGRARAKRTRDGQAKWFVADPDAPKVTRVMPKAVCDAEQAQWTRDVLQRKAERERAHRLARERG
jgi:predicted ArsR family transcriptional regulator